jgi:hypothetical protein
VTIFTVGFRLFFNPAANKLDLIINDHNPDLEDIVNDFTPEMFTATGIEVLGTL